MNKILIYGYGNPGRQDDGIGAQFVEMVDEWIKTEQLYFISTDCNYQLNIEDAATIADFDIVLFVDASVVEDLVDYKLETIEPNDATIEFTMHAVSTSFVVDLCQKLYGKTPHAYVLHVKAYEFDFIEGLTQNATGNLNEAFKFMKKFVSDKIA